MSFILCPLPLLLFISTGIFKNQTLLFLSSLIHPFTSYSLLHNTASVSHFSENSGPILYLTTVTLIRQPVSYPALLFEEQFEEN